MTRDDFSPQAKTRPRSAAWWRRHSVIAVGAMVVVVLLACAGIAGYVGWNLTHPQRLALNGSPADLGLDYQDVSFSSRADNVLLSGWYIPADDDTGAIVVMAHGYRKNRLDPAAALPLAQALHDRGFSAC